MSLCFTRISKYNVISLSTIISHKINLKLWSTIKVLVIFDHLFDYFDIRICLYSIVHCNSWKMFIPTITSLLNWLKIKNIKCIAITRFNNFLSFIEDCIFFSISSVGHYLAVVKTSIELRIFCQFFFSPSLLEIFVVLSSVSVHQIKIIN